MKMEEAKAIRRTHRKLEALRSKLATIAGRSTGRRVPGEPVVRLKPRVKGVHSGKKGGNFENVVAKILADWYGGIWKRTPKSGGWSGASVFGMKGDLVCSIEQPFHVECKNREGWHLDDLITGVRERDSRSLLEWWEQACRESPKGKWPLLIFRRNFLKVNLCMMFRLDFDRFAFDRPATILEFLPTMEAHLEGSALIHGHGEVVIFALEDLVAYVRPPLPSPHHGD